MEFLRRVINNWFNFAMHRCVYSTTYSVLSECLKKNFTGDIRTHDLLLTSADVLTSRPPSHLRARLNELLHVLFDVFILFRHNNLTKHDDCLKFSNECCHYSDRVFDFIASDYFRTGDFRTIGGGRLTVPFSIAYVILSMRTISRTMEKNR